MPYFDISTQQFSMLVSSYSISAFVSGLAAAFFVDQFDRKKILIFGYTGFLIGTFFCAFAPTYWLLLIARIIAGLFGGLIGAQVLSIAADLVPYDKRAAAMGIIMTSFSISSVLGVPVGLYLAGIFSWHAPFVTVAGVGILVLIMLIRYLPSMTVHLGVEEKSKDFLLALKNIFTDKNQVAAILLTATIMGQFMIIPFLNPFMEFNVGFTKDQIPLIYFVGGGLTLVGAPLVGKLADRIGKFKLLIATVILTLPALAIITNMPSIPFYYVLCVTGCWFLISSGRGIAAQAMVTEVVPSKTRGSFMSVNSSIQQLAIGLYAAIGGFIVQNTESGKIEHFNIAGYVAMSITFISLLFGSKLNAALNKLKRANYNKTADIEKDQKELLVTE